MPSADLTQAVRDTVTVESRNRMGRSQTQNPSSPKPSPTTAKRSQSQDSAQVVQDKKSGKSRSKKGSQHADVIDRLDFTGVGPMFHHDGPFDACAPSRNRHKTKAPMMAWTSGEVQAGNGGPYPAPNAYQGFSESYEAPKKKVDAIAEAWGIHEPEPFEEFFAGGGTRGDTPASSIYNGRDSHLAPRKKERRDHAEDGNRSRNARRSTLPPPQPIFIHDAQADQTESPPATSTAFPKRSKSIMQRIRKMRDSPNVPAPADFDDPPSPSSSPPDSAARPTHRSQNSFLGKFNSSSKPEHEPFVYIDAHTNKDLPATPAKPAEAAGYFDTANGSATAASPGGGLGRKTSIMKKVGKVVRGTR